MAQAADKAQYTFKVSVLGAADIGRSKILSTITLAAVWDSFDAKKKNEYRTSLYVRHGVPTLELRALVHPAHLLDQEHLVKTGDAFILLYKVTDRSSFEFLNNLHKTLFGPSEERKPLWLCARTDVAYDQWKVSLDEAERFSSKIGARFHTLSRDYDGDLRKLFADEIIDCVFNGGSAKEAIEGPSAVGYTQRGIK